MENRFHDSKMPLVVGFNDRINDQRIDISRVNSSSLLRLFLLDLEKILFTELKSNWMEKISKVFWTSSFTQDTCLWTKSKVNFGTWLNKAKKKVRSLSVLYLRTTPAVSLLSHAYFFTRWQLIPDAINPARSIDENQQSEKQSINRNQSIKLVNWYRLLSINRWSIDSHTKTVRRLLSIGKTSLT